MPIKKEPFTFLEDFSIVPMDSGSYMLEQGLNFSRGFSSLAEVVEFLIEEKKKFFAPTKQPPDAYDGGYEDYDRTGTPDYGNAKEDE